MVAREQLERAAGATGFPVDAHLFVNQPPPFIPLGRKNLGRRARYTPSYR